MPYKFGDPQLPKQIATLASGVVANKLIVTPTMNMVTDNRFYGRPGDAVTVRVAKPLPVRQYDLNNDRNEPIKMDRLSYSTQTLTAEADRVYSAVGVTEEDFDFSVLTNWTEVVAAQSSAMANGFEQAAHSLLRGAKYEYVKHIDITPQAIKEAQDLGQDAVFNALLDARQSLARMGSPVLAGSQVYAVAGSDWASLMRKNQRLTLVAGTGDVANAFNSSVIGTYAGITVVEDFTVDPKELLLYTKDAFNVWSAAPSVPVGVEGSTVKGGSLNMRWILDYDSGYAVNRSILSAYTGFGVSEDFVEALDQANNSVLSEERYFIRGAKLVLGAGTDILPGNGKGEGAGASADSFLAKRFKGERVTTKFGAGVFADLTYQNVIESHVAAGKPETVVIPAGYAPEKVNEVVPGEGS